MKKGLAIVIMCCAFALSLGLAACGGSSSGSAASSASSASTSASSAASSASASSSAASSAASSASSSSSSKLEGVYDGKAREMESSKNDFIKSLNSDAESIPKEMAEARNSVIDDDLEHMTTNINEIYDSGIQWLEEAGGSDADLQTYKDKLATLRDSCIAELERTANDLKA